LTEIIVIGSKATTAAGAGQASENSMRDEVVSDVWRLGCISRA